MNILFDLLHPADVNLFKYTIINLKDRGHNVFIAYRRRGALECIAKTELVGFELFQLGEHRKNLFGKIFSLIQHEFLAFRFFKKHKINLVVTQGMACGFACKIRGVKILHYDDDSEYRFTFLLGKWFADIDVMPDFMPVEGKNFYKYHGYKELAYLHPSYFTPTIVPLSQYEVEPQGYVFIREISNVSVNYINHMELMPEIVKYLVNKGLRILLSLEDKSLLPKYQDSCIVLKEPIENLHSIIYFSKFVISSGDTMAREACLLGKPCLYTANREMMANKQFIDLGVMVKTQDLNEIYKTIDKYIEESYHLNTKLIMEKLINEEFVDTNKVLISQIERIIKL